MFAHGSRGIVIFEPLEVVKFTHVPPTRDQSYNEMPGLRRNDTVRNDLELCEGENRFSWKNTLQRAHTRSFKSFTSQDIGRTTIPPSESTFENSGLTNNNIFSQEKCLRL